MWMIHVGIELYFQHWYQMVCMLLSSSPFTNTSAAIITYRFTSHWVFGCTGYNLSIIQIHSFFFLQRLVSLAGVICSERRKKSSVMVHYATSVSRIYKRVTGWLRGYLADRTSSSCFKDKPCRYAIIHGQYHQIANSLLTYSSRLLTNITKSG